MYHSSLPQSLGSTQSDPGDDAQELGQRMPAEETCAARTKVLMTFFGQKRQSKNLEPKAVFHSPISTMGGILTNIWPFASELFDLKEKLTNAKKTRREAVALYCEKIADTADEMLRVLKQNQIPDGPWAKMEVYRTQMPEIVRGLIPEDNITALAYWLDTRLTAAEFLNDFNNPMHQEGITSELSSSAGTLRALAESLRAKR